MLRGSILGAAGDRFRAERGTLAICECRFRDEASINAAFASPEASDVIGRCAALHPYRAAPRTRDATLKETVDE
jgi:hypothetical protein